MVIGKVIQSSVRWAARISLFCLPIPHISAAPLRLPYPVEHRLVEDAETLNVEPEKLRLARLSLIRATELSEPVNSRTAGSPMGLYFTWKNIHGSNATAVLEFLFEKMRSVASAAQTEWYYTWSTTFAADILSEMARIDPTKAMAFAHSWPKPNLTGRSEQKYNYFFDSIAYPYLKRKAAEDLDEALALLEQFARERDGTRPDQRIRVHIAARLRSFGRMEEGLELIRTGHEQFRATVPDEQLVLDFLSSLRSLSDLDVELFFEGVELLDQKMDELPWDEPFSHLFSKDKRSEVPVTKRERTLPVSYTHLRAHET